MVSVQDLKKSVALNVSVTVKLMSMLAELMRLYTIRKERCALKMREQSTPICFPMSMLYAEASLAKVFQLLENGEDLTISEEHFSLKLPELLPSKNLHFCSLKMFPDFYRMTKGGLLRQSSVHWTTSGMMYGGKCLTLQISEFPNPEKDCSLLDIKCRRSIGFHRVKSKDSC